ncbi:unnamed protein product [Symbiodinium microadriaticum]|nr:unnamed protein product [Symbiodinium microadriaticum]
MQLCYAAVLPQALSHPLKFPAQLEDLSEPLKIDVLQPIASTRLVLHPHEEYYGIGFEHADNLAMGLHVRAAPGGAEAGPAKELPIPTKDSAASAKDYLEQNGLLKYVQSLLHAVIQDKPQDPFAYMIEQLTAAKSKSEACARVPSRPTSAVHRSRPTSAMRPASAQIRATPPLSQPLLEAPAPEEEPPALPAGQMAAAPAFSEARKEEAESSRAAPPTSVQREAEHLVAGEAVPEQASAAKLRQSQEDFGTQAQDAEDPAAAIQRQRLEELDQSADVKQSILKALADASESGDLGMVLSAVGVDKSRSRIQALLEKSAETGELEAALKRTMDTKDVADLDKLKGHLRDVLLDANESGQVLDILAQISRPEKPEATEASEIEKLKANLKSLLLDANESGRVLAVLQEMSAEKAEEAGAQKALEEVSEMEHLKQRMKAALFDADPSAVLQALEKTKRMGQPDAAGGPEAKTAAPALPRATHELVNAQAKMQEGLRNGLLQQGLEKVMQKGDVKEAKDRLRETMNESAEREGLVLKADSIALEELSAIKGRMKDVMMKAAETGTLAKELEKLLESVAAERPPGLPGQSDLEALGEKLRGVLEEASDTGKLEEALRLLREEQEETMKNAPKDDLEAVRSNLCTVVEDAVDSGKLAAALDALRSYGEPQPSSAAASDQIAVIKAKFRRLLKEALESGMLAAKVGILKHPGKVPAPPQGEPPHEMEIMKAHLREALQHAAECGQLAEALASARSLEGAEQRGADVEATAVKLRGVLAEAALCGRLEETLKALQKDDGSLAEPLPAEAAAGKAPEVAPEATATNEELSTDEVAEQPPGMEQAASELECLRGRLRNILEVALEKGNLEQAVQVAVERQSPAHARSEPAGGSEQAMAGLQVEVDEIRREGRELLLTVDRLFSEMQELQQANLRLAQRLDLAGSPHRRQAAAALQQQQPEMTEEQALAMLPREGDLPGLQAQVGRMREESQSLRSTVDRLTREMEELKRINDDLAAKVDDANMPDP